jgi:hypothetical protein
MNVVDWLLDSDPAIRWQAMRDLSDAGPTEIGAERARVALEGLGAEILARQEADGSWHRDDRPVWLPTLFTLLLLHATGVDAKEAAVESAMTRLDSGLRWNDNGGCWNLRPAHTGGNRFFDGEEEPCINGGVLALSGYFGHPSEALARRLMREQLEDGGWNCEAPKSKRSSFHTTICVLEGLLEYERAAGYAPEVAAARRKGEEYFLKRGLFRRFSTGEVVSPEFLEFAFPPRYCYDVLRALDYLRAAGHRSDTGMSEAVNLVKSKRQPDGRWLLDAAYDDVLAVPVKEFIGGPSAWNTLRALRVLRWARADD